jgi:uncharacterized membrane-anchored protein YhcB (DUF1043 family)
MNPHITFFGLWTIGLVIGLIIGAHATHFLSKLFTSKDAPRREKAS